MKVLFATTNPAKIKYYAEELKKRNIDIITLKDLNINLDVEETGKDAVENATLKATAYYNLVKIPTIAIDDNLYLEGLSQENQPGVNVRRVNGKRLTDDEMIEYYSNLVQKNGGKIKAKWVKGIAIYNGKNVKTFTYSRSSFYFIDKPSDKKHEGYPLDSIAIIPEYNKYLTELTEKENEEYKKQSSNKEVFDFMMNNL
ncbi:MAG: non-canonical purine NTP pyrophosphatase [Clostridia bacterium]